MKIYCISAHGRSKQYTEESGLLISRILIQQVSRIYCPQTRTLNITMVRDSTLWVGGKHCRGGWVKTTENKIHCMAPLILAMIKEKFFDTQSAQGLL